MGGGDPEMERAAQLDKLHEELMDDFSLGDLDDYNGPEEEDSDF